MGIVRKMRFIETLREGERISEVYLCRHKQTAMTKAGKPYDSLTLQDKTGTLDAKIWDVSFLTKIYTIAIYYSVC